MNSKIPPVSDETKAVLKKYFENFDKDKNGMIDIHELDAAFQSAGLHFPRRVMKKLIAQAHHSEAKGINFEEFCELSAFIEHMRTTFDINDVDKNGRIDLLELGNALLDLGYQFDKHKIISLMKAVDVDHSKDIQFEEWVDLSFYLRNEKVL